GTGGWATSSTAWRARTGMACPRTTRRRETPAGTGSGGEDGEIESESLPGEGARGRGGRGRRVTRGGGREGGRQAREEGPLERRQAAGEAPPLQSRRLLREPRLRVRHRRSLRGGHQGPHQARAGRDPEEAGGGRLVDGEGPEGERLPERPQGLRRHERGVPRPLRSRAGGAHDRGPRGRDPRQLAGRA